MVLVGGVHDRSCTSCGRCYGLWSFPAEINQRVSGRLAGLQSCNCLFFANIANIIIAGVITVAIIVALTIVVVVDVDMNIITILIINQAASVHN